MFEEPFRWMEAIATRHSYVQEKLKKGQPVIALPYDEGALMLGFSPQPGKIFEIYDRIALGSMGHPADVEKLRMAFLDLAHLEGFNRSEKDVTLCRLLQFGIAPSLKQNFEEVMRAPYLVQFLLMEIDFSDKAKFFRLNYDGHWETFSKGSVITGNPKQMEKVDAAILNLDTAGMPLDKAFKEACTLWEMAKNSDEEEKPFTFKQALDGWVLEAAILTKTSHRRSLFQWITNEDVQKFGVIDK